MTNTSQEALDLEQLIATEPALALYFSADSCGVCHALYPRLEAMFVEDFPQLRLLRLRTEDLQQQAAQLGVLSIPTLIIYLDHREQQRYVRQISVEGVRQDLSRPYALMFSD